MPFSVNVFRFKKTINEQINSYRIQVSNFWQVVEKQLTSNFVKCFFMGIFVQKGSYG